MRKNLLLIVPLIGSIFHADAEQKVVRDVRYGERHERQCLDLYLPSDSNPDSALPCLVFIHGGGWRQGNKGVVRNLPMEEILASGYAVVSVNYELSSHTNLCWPRNLDDCRQAVQYLQKKAGDYGLDPERFVLAGESAGGHLALMTAYTREASGPICGVVAFFPVCDLTLKMKSFPTAYWGEPFMPESFADNPELYASGSPVNHIESNVPPTLVFHGTADKVVELELHSKVLVERLTNAGVEAELVSLDGAGHTLKWGKHTDLVSGSILEFLETRKGASDVETRRSDFGIH
ncbi:MAG: alpha/beta hydrolase [Verrucomicrobiota bacterium]